MKRKLLLLTGLLLTSLASNAQGIQFNKSTIDANTSSQPYAVASGHLNNDTYLDLVIGTYNSSKVIWYKNNGDLTYQPGITLTATGSAALSYIESVTTGDLNNDGHTDILATGSYNNRLVWFENNGDDTFEPAVAISSGITGAGAVKVANLDNDINNNLDIIVTAYSSNSVVYFLGNGNGTFGTMRTLVQETAGAGPASFDIADFDVDGDLDVVVGYTGNGNVKLYDNKIFQDGLDGSGNIPFEPYTNPVDFGNDYLWTVAFGDINNDGIPNIIKSDSEPTGGNPTLAWFKNNASGITTTFEKTVVPTSFPHGGAIGVADLNNDGYNELILGNGYATGADLICFEGSASSGLGSEIILDNTSGGMFSMVTKDFNNDGKVDIAAINYLNHGLNLFINDTTLSNPKFETTDLTMYPNPTSNSLHFKGNIAGDLNVSVYNVLGKRVINNVVKLGQSLDVSKLNNGVYIIKFNDYNTTYKFVKQ
ncbi:T9SS type A sorting domain-containing protein [Lacinutrix sp. WUR7]|uniref:T9SS type A sorting domain-containing protein n=1 Tax=Lacinutrix sp. WUR7 TaxID=2653681 RepID=UPI00193E64E8|nr:T9SS type A sorting domain-containing protein [Lacinutrix sp. WUR7]QRM90074.1 T9SS type A sorting domain-containing protein [Lacinutrix sp. WUR7]